MKKILSIKSSLYILIFIAFAFFVTFEVSLYLKLAMMGLVLFAYFMAKIKKTDFALMLTVFLIFFDLFNFLYIRPLGYTFPVSIAMLLAVALGCLLFYMGLAIRESDTEMKIKKNLNFFYTFILGLVLLEVFLSMSFWQIDPKNKSIILLVAFYLVWGLVCLRVENMLSLRKVFLYLFLSFLTLIMTLLTINKWQIY